MELVPALLIRDLSFSYDGRPVLTDVNLSIPVGDFVSIVGPNGGGKTTLLKLALGLLKPARGEIKLFGEKPEKMRSRIGYMPQNMRFDPKFPAKVMDVVLMGRLRKGNPLGPYPKTDKEIAENAMQEVGVDSLRSRPFSSLSGGQKQRVLIARALACQPDLLLLDEPTSNLDLMFESEFYDLLQKLNERLTIALVSHDFGFVSRVVKTVVCVKQKVVIHPTTEMTGEIINDIYGSPMRMVRHDHKATGDSFPACLSS
ncbi:MAG: ABC transporter ATP-binding protein [Deltaproteobacteria bacterium]|nr:ABC transporter ATP-binding protein [Deltaproteobacteria bacterium]